jgi:hypothetical protein
MNGSAQIFGGGFVERPLLCKAFIILPSCLPCFQLHPLVVVVLLCVVMEEEEEVMRETCGVYLHLCRFPSHPQLTLPSFFSNLIL